MESKEIDIKNCTCYYFHDIIRAWSRDIDANFSGALLDEKLYKTKTKTFYFMTFHKKLKQVQNIAY